MCIDVLKSLRLHLVRSVAIIGLGGLVAGCSADVARFDDGFYTGAVPQAPVAQTAANQPYPGDVDRMNTGSINGRGLPAYPGSTTNSAPTASVQSNQLPPPPAPSYGNTQQTQYAEPRQSAAYTPSVSAPSDGVTRGAPPSTLQEQAAHVSVPSERPTAPQRRQAGNQSSSVTVESGDTLLGIARRTGVSTADIKRANGMDSDVVRLGQTLVIPNGSSSGQKVASAERSKPETSTPRAAPKPTPEPYTPPKTAEKEDRESAEAATAPKAERVASEPQADQTTVSQQVEEQQASIAPKTTGISRFRWPAQGRVVSRFGEKVGSRRNDGLNISVPRGTPIKAAENGVVIYAGDGLKEFGKTVLVKHDDGLVTVYGHADKLEVQRGAKVTRGQEIAKSGMSGDTSIPIVHFEVRKNSTPVDPTKYLQ